MSELPAMPEMPEMSEMAAEPEATTPPADSEGPASTQADPSDGAAAEAAGANGSPEPHRAIANVFDEVRRLRQLSADHTSLLSRADRLNEQLNQELTVPGAAMHLATSARDVDGGRGVLAPDGSIRRIEEIRAELSADPDAQPRLRFTARLANGEPAAEPEESDSPIVWGQVADLTALAARDLVDRYEQMLAAMRSVVDSFDARFTHGDLGPQ